MKKESKKLVDIKMNMCKLYDGQELQSAVPVPDSETGKYEVKSFCFKCGYFCPVYGIRADKLITERIVIYEF